MGRLKWRNFTRGWWPTGARDAIPDGAARRTEGIAPDKTTALRSRLGSTLLASLDAHSVFRFAGIRYAGETTKYYRLDTSPPLAIETGLDGTKLQMAVMPPTLGFPDWSFLSGGALLFKVSQAGQATQWGIDPPDDGFTAVANAPNTKVIDALDAAGGWTASGCTLADEATIKQEGANSMRMSVPATVVASATKAIAVDLTQFAGPLPSPLEDFISVWVRVDLPENLASITLSFDVSGGNFATEYYHYTMGSSTQEIPGNQNSQQIAGLGSLAVFAQGQEAGLFALADPQGITSVQSDVAQTFLPNIHDNWVLLRVPKAIFLRAGDDTTKTWANVAAVRLGASANAGGPITVYWDDLKLSGGAGMQGDYKYQVIFRNSQTGSRSNPNPTEVTVLGVNRGTVLLANLPKSSDPQVDEREIYRTVGNGTLKFRITTLHDNTTTTFTDGVGDFAGLDSSGANLMDTFQLQTDNIRPNDSWDDCAGPFAGCMWWARSPNIGERGRVFYSPPGRAEAAPNFLDLTGDDEPTMKIMVWNGSLWCFTIAGLYQISGTAEPFYSRKIFGVPGTKWPYTVAITAYGIAYLADDGPRLFDGAGSRLIYPQAIHLLFRGEIIEDTAFVK